MSFLESLVLSITMAADAMCAGASDGIKEHKIRISKCVIIALCFGFAQFLMPVIGYFIGYAVYEYIAVYIPWIAFAVMLILGFKSIIDGYKEYRERKKQVAEGEVCDTEAKVKPLEIFMQTIATSIDALSVGFSLIGSVPKIFDAMMVFTTIGVVISKTSPLIWTVADSEYSPSWPGVTDILCVALSNDIDRLSSAL